HPLAPLLSKRPDSDSDDPGANQCRPRDGFLHRRTAIFRSGGRPSVHTERARPRLRHDNGHDALLLGDYRHGQPPGRHHLRLRRPTHQVSVTDGDSDPHPSGGCRTSRARSWEDAFRRLADNRLALASFFLVLVFVAVALLAPLVAPFNPNE